MALWGAMRHNGLMLKPTKQNVVYCFSPPVMIATCVIELSLAGYTWWRYKSRPVSRLVMITLVLLATFQLAEYLICGYMSDPALWAKIGYIAITLLPPVGLHLASKVAGKRINWLLLAG